MIMPPLLRQFTWHAMSRPSTRVTSLSPGANPAPILGLTAMRTPPLVPPIPVLVAALAMAFHPACLHHTKHSSKSSDATWCSCASMMSILLPSRPALPPDKNSLIFPIPPPFPVTIVSSAQLFLALFSDTEAPDVTVDELGPPLFTALPPLLGGHPPPLPPGPTTSVAFESVSEPFLLRDPMFLPSQLPLEVSPPPSLATSVAFESVGVTAPDLLLDPT